jgi:hypothetical protein
VEPPGNFQVLIDWGDQTPATDPSAVGFIQQDAATRTYLVYGSHVYSAGSPNPYQIHVTIVDGPNPNGEDVTATITDDAGNYALQNTTASTTASITPAGTAPTITSGNGTTFTAGAAGSFTVMASGSPTPTLSKSGTLPGGVTFVDNHDGTATLAGNARSRSVGTYQLTITADNGVGSPATQNFTLTIAPGDLNRAFVQSLYLDVLNRQGSTEEVNAWVRAIRAGVTYDTVAKGFWESPEHRRLEVDGYYVTYLHRPADPNGEKGWVAAFLGGLTERDVIRGFVTSREYLSTRKGDAEFVRGLYQDVLGRPAQPDELARWLNALDSGVSRAAVAVAFLDSPEGLGHLISDLYLTLLHRRPDPREVVAGAKALSSGATVTSIAELFLTSGEYLSKI